MIAVSGTDRSIEQEVLEMIQKQQAIDLGLFLIYGGWPKLRNKAEVFDKLHGNKQLVKTVHDFIVVKAGMLCSGSGSLRIELEEMARTLLKDHPDIGDKDQWTRPDTP